MPLDVNGRFWTGLDCFLANPPLQERGAWTLLDCSGYVLGAGRGNRTPMVSPPRDFESRASTNSAIPAACPEHSAREANYALIGASTQLRRPRNAAHPGRL